MMTPWVIAGNAGHALAGVLLAGLAVMSLHRANRAGEGWLLGIAVAFTALWSLCHAVAGLVGVDPLSDGVAETVRNGAWLAVLAAMLRSGVRAGAVWRGRLLLVCALVLLLVVQLGMDLVAIDPQGKGRAAGSTLAAGWLLRCLFALGALMLLHGLAERRTHPATRRQAACVGGALAFLWAYDFNHYFLAWLSGDPLGAIGPMRGFVMALLAGMLGLGLYGDSARPMALSRPMRMRLVMIIFFAVYLLAVALLAVLTGKIVAPLGQVTQFTVLFALAVGLLALLSSATLRAWLRVELSKHLFAHRYDYRTLWLGFAATMAEEGSEGPSLDSRITRAIAEAMAVPGAQLFLPGEDGRLTRVSGWGAPPEGSIDSLDAALTEQLGRTGWIVDIAADWVMYGALLPAWTRRSAQAWALAPLIHGEALQGAILLAAPRPVRRLDWEDLDVLRVVCSEAAARISEARSRTALAEAQRFDDFNRRFAFILHDLKNLVSNMSLLASNAERHADNPAFREDMVLTLKETAARMTDLLQRLARPGPMAAGKAAGLMLGPLVRALAPRWSAQAGSIVVEGETAPLVHADADGLARALDHLVRNALEASPPDSPVRVCLEADDSEARIHVIDQGEGMSAAFIADQLFHPFSSTKAGGFGLGAHEARLLVQAMGGHLAVESVPNQGTRFTIHLPLAEGSAVPAESTRKAG